MENFFDIIGSKSLTLVDFCATRCGPRKARHDVLEQLNAQAGCGVLIIKLDVDRARSVAEQYGIMAVPTLILFREGKVLWRQSGAMPLADLMNVIGQYA